MNHFPPLEGSSLRPVVEPGASEVFREPGERYTVKRYESEKVPVEDSWRHAKITLKPVNPSFASIELAEAEAGQVHVIAECIELLGSESGVRG